MKKHLILLFSVCLGLSSCEKVFLKPNPKTDKLSIFNEYATLVEEKYAMLDPKGVDIRQLKDSIAQTITGDESEKEFFNKLALITSRLRDGHSVLASEKYFQTFKFEEGYPAGRDRNILLKNYINTTSSPDLTIDEDGEQEEGSPIKLIKIAYGTLLNHKNVGYIRIPSFNVEIKDNTIENAFESIQQTDGLIIDVRGNYGGNPSLAVKFASYLIDSPLYTGYEKFKTGPGTNDFTNSDITMQPTTSPNKYLNKPVIILTDRACYSATTTFCYSVDPIPNLLFMGQRTGGGSGSVTDGYLANGWYWALSTSEFVDIKNRHLDDGFEPDIAVVLDKNNSSRDEVIETAVEKINQSD